MTEQLAIPDVEGEVLRDLHDQCRARFKADVPDAPDWLVALFTDALIGRPRPQKDNK